MRTVIAFAFSLLLTASAGAQSYIYQSGSVTPGHVPAWVTNGVLGDGGTAAAGKLSSVGVTASGPAICQNSGATSGPYNQLCLGVTQTGGGQISLYNYNGATGGFTLNYNGSDVGLGVVVLPTTANDFSCFTNTTGTMHDCGVGPSTLPLTINATLINGATAGQILYSDGTKLQAYGITGTAGSVVLSNSPTLVTPVLGVASGTSLALGGCTIGSSILCLNGFTQGAIPYIGANGGVLGSTSVLFLDSAHSNTLGIGSAAPYTDNNNALGGVIRLDNSGPNRFSIVNQSTNAAASSQLNLNLGTPTGANFTMGLSTVTGQVYAELVVDSVPVQMIFAAPDFAWENAAEITAFAELNSTFFKVYNTTAATNTVTGSGIFAGGVGVAGDLFVGGTTSGITLLTSFTGAAQINSENASTNPLATAYLLAAMTNVSFAYVYLGVANGTTPIGELEVGSGVSSFVIGMNSVTIETLTKGGGVQIGAPTGADCGAGCLNAASLKVNNVAVTTTANTVTSFSAGTTGLTPNSATVGAVTLGGSLVVANGGTNCSAASITCFNNITGFSAAGTTGTTSTNLVFSTSPTLVTPTLGVAAATSVAIGGCTIGGNAFCVTGSSALGATTVSAASFTLSGNQSAAAWTTSGIRYVNPAVSYTDTSSNGTVTVAYTDLFGASTILASSATTYTNYYGSYFQVPVASTNVTMTNKFALGADSMYSGSLAINSDTGLAGAQLWVHVATGLDFTVFKGASAAVSFGTVNDTYGAYVPMYFDANPMAINSQSGGNTCIAETTCSVVLHVHGSFGTDGSVALTGISNAAGNEILCYNTSGGPVTYENAVAGCVPSDPNLKDKGPDLIPSDALTKLVTLDPGSGKFREGTNLGTEERVWLYADQVCALDHKLCVVDSNGIRNYDKIGMLVYTIAAVQALKADNDNLHAEIKQLRAAK